MDLFKKILKNDKWFLKQIKSGWISISKKGIVTNNRTGKILGSISNSYCVIGLYQANKQCTRFMLIHRLLWLVYKGLIPYGMTINHKDGNKRHNRLRNLEVVTYQENCQHAFDSGLHIISNKERELITNRMRGETNPNACFTDRIVLKLRKKYKNGKISIETIASEYNVSTRSVKSMLTGKTYPHVNEAIKDIDSRPGAPVKFTNKDIQKWARLRKAGMSTKDIAKKYKTHPSTVSRKTAHLL